MASDTTQPSPRQLAEQCLRELEGRDPVARQSVLLEHFERLSLEVDRLYQLERQLRCDLDAERNTNAQLAVTLNALEVTSNCQHRMLTEQNELFDNLRNLLLFAPYAVNLRQPLTGIISDLIERAKAAGDFEMMLMRVCRAALTSGHDLTDSALTRVLQQANDLVKRKRAGMCAGLREDRS